MSDFGLKRNGSGYYDETAYKGLTMKRPGEIWTSYNGDVLIIAAHDRHCTTLKLKEKGDLFTDGLLTVDGDKCTDPAMLGYTFNDTITSYVKRLPDDEFDEIIEAINLALAIDIPIHRTEEKPAEIKVIDRKAEDEAKEWLEMLKMANNENHQLRGQLQAYKDFLSMLMGKES